MRPPSSCSQACSCPPSQADISPQCQHNEGSAQGNPIEPENLMLKSYTRVDLAYYSCSDAKEQFYETFMTGTRHCPPTTLFTCSNSRLMPKADISARPFAIIARPATGVPRRPLSV